jgi:sugar lactone lactonase YvrE
MMNTAARFLCSAALAVGLATPAQDSVRTVAGQASVSGTANGVGTNAQFNDPAGLTADPAGNLYLADTRNHVIRRIGTNGAVTTFAGQMGVAGSGNGTGTQARFNTPSGIAIDTAGFLFVTDTGNHTVRKITPAGVVSTIAGGAGQSGFTDALGPAARFNSPLGIAVAANGSLYVADCGNHLIRAISTSGGVTTLAGTPETWGSADGVGAAARFNGPVGLALDQQGHLFVSDANNHTIRKIIPGGIVSTWAGAPGIDGSTNGDRGIARFAKPAELVFDTRGNLLVADSFNHVIRSISPDGLVSTVTGLPGSRGSSDGVNGQGRLFNPYGIAIGPDGALWVADTYNELIRVVLVPFKVRLEMVGGSSSHAIITWDAEVGRRYQVQHRADPGQSGWVNLGSPVAAESVTATLTDLTGSADEPRLYRVIVTD